MEGWDRPSKYDVKRAPYGVRVRRAYALAGWLLHRSTTTLDNSLRISSWRSETRAFLFSSSKEMTIYSILGMWLFSGIIHGSVGARTSSPQSNWSHSRPFRRSQMFKNCVMPCSRTWSACFFPSGQLSGVPRTRRPIEYENRELAGREQMVRV